VVILSPSLSVILTLNEVKGKNLTSLRTGLINIEIQKSKVKNQNDNPT